MMHRTISNISPGHSLRVASKETVRKMNGGEGQPSGCDDGLVLGWQDAWGAQERAWMKWTPW